MTRLASAVFLISMALVGKAHAQAKAIVDELNADAARLPALNSAMSQAAQDNLLLRKEYEAIAADQKRESEELKKEIAQQIRTVKTPLERKIADETEDYRTRCAESRAGKLAPPQYQDCLARKARTEADVAALRKQWSEHSTRWNAENVAPANEKIAKQNARMAQISAQMRANVERFTEAQDKFLAARQRIDRNLMALKQACNPLATSPADTPFGKAERMKWCASIDPGDYVKKLPPLFKADEATGK